MKQMYLRLRVGHYLIFRKACTWLTYQRVQTGFLISSLNNKYLTGWKVLRRIVNLRYQKREAAL
jgi:hypothetical protein